MDYLLFGYIWGLLMPYRTKNIFTSSLALNLTPICAALALAGCDLANDDYAASRNIFPSNQVFDPANYVEKDGVTGKVLAGNYVVGATVCFDANKDGICNSNEPSERSYNGGKYSFAKSVSDQFPDDFLIAQVKGATTNDESYLLTANRATTGNTHISPFTTLVVNEQLYNPYLGGDYQESINYLIDPLNGVPVVEAELKGEDYSADSTQQLKASQLTTSYAAAYALQQNVPLDTIANVVDEVVKASNVSVTVTSIVAQERVARGLSITDLSLGLSWTTSHNDELIIGATVDSTGDKVIAYSKWHNGLNILDTSNQTASPTQTSASNFLNVIGDRHHVDTSTGASEQELSKVVSSSDGSSIYSMVQKAYENTTGDIGVGIYSSSISTTVPTTIFASVVTGTNYYPYPAITDISLSEDNTQLIAAGNNNRVLLFDSTNLTSPTLSITTSDKIRSVAITLDKQFILAGAYKKFGHYLSIYDATTGVEITHHLLNNTSADYPKNILVLNDNEIFVLLNGSNTIYHYNIADKQNISLVNTFTASNQVNKITLSADKQYLIAVQSLKKVSIFDINHTDKIASVSLLGDAVEAFEIAAGKLAIVSSKSTGATSANDAKIGYYEVIDLGGVAITNAEKLAWKLDHRTP